ncbi:hypothetical protein [Krasilnikovia cinnamomea]|uniref:hypothetical protein n=1 Tax=Krasilnikovia cinnamomea TaxID=349313 RepID=UPI0013EF4235|nr:hypothetical protein [Krasilnikovia cinnamomea]
MRESPLVVASASQLPAATVLNTFPNTGLVQPTALDARDAHPGTLRRAVAYMAHP